MCGRFFLATPGPELARHFGLAMTPTLRPRFNLAPGQAVPLVYAHPAGERLLGEPLWGFVGGGAVPGRHPINARAESAARAPAFRDALRHRRGLVPADGFYEWQHAGRSSRPFAVRPHQGGLLALAALYQRGDDGAPASCVLLTTESRGDLRAIHDRMPLLVPAAAFERWLDPAPQDGTLLAALAAGATAELETHPVDRRVNDVREDDARLIEPERDLFSPGGSP